MVCSSLGERERERKEKGGMEKGKGGKGGPGFAKQLTMTLQEQQQQGRGTTMQCKRKGSQGKEGTNHIAHVEGVCDAGCNSTREEGGTSGRNDLCSQHQHHHSPILFLIFFGAGPDLASGRLRSRWALGTGHPAEVSEAKAGTSRSSWYMRETSSSPSCIEIIMVYEIDVFLPIMYIAEP